MPNDSSQYRISGFVLAGGSSTRLRRDKVLLPWKHKTLIDYATDRLRPLCETVRVCANRDDLDAYRPLVRDALPNAGPLAGIVPALEHSASDWNFFLAVDLPLLPEPVLQFLADRARASRQGILGLVPDVDGFPQPLCALLRRRLAPGLRRAMEEGKYKIMYALREAVKEIPGAEIKLVPMAELAEASPKERLSPADWFLNINTPEDWQRALKLGSALE
jgi:molybdopterin-guanine dinucleotide biosynthesis protein A